MGADLYNSKRLEANEEKYQKEYLKARDRVEDYTEMVQANKTPKGGKTLKELEEERWKLYELIHNEEAYFRDSYNDSSVMAAMDLSWWRDVIPMLENSCLTPDGCRRLADMIRDRPITKPKSWGQMEDDYFHKKRERLVKFLELGAEDGCGIECSL